MTNTRIPSVGEVNARRFASWIDSAPAGTWTQLPPDASGEGLQFPQIEAVVAAEEARGRVVRDGLCLVRL